MIGDEVNITVLGVKGNQVRFGINAPISIPVHREEIYLKVKKEEEQGIFYKKPAHVKDDTNQTVN